MPAKLEHKIQHELSTNPKYKHLSEKSKNAILYSVLRKTGWKPGKSALNVNNPKDDNDHGMTPYTEDFDNQTKTVADTKENKNHMANNPHETDHIVNLEMADIKENTNHIPTGPDDTVSPKALNLELADTEENSNHVPHPAGDTINSPDWNSQVSDVESNKTKEPEVIDPPEVTPEEESFADEMVKNMYLQLW